MRRSTERCLKSSRFATNTWPSSFTPNMTASNVSTCWKSLRELTMRPKLQVTMMMVLTMMYLRVLTSLTPIGVPIVKLEDRQLAKSVGVFAHPSIVLFRNFGDDATIYAGDLKNEEAILEWMLIQKDPSNEAIESKEGESLDRIIKHHEAVAVFLCQYMETCVRGCVM